MPWLLRLESKAALSRFVKLRKAGEAKIGRARPTISYLRDMGGISAEFGFVITSSDSQGLWDHSGFVKLLCFKGIFPL